MSYRDSHLERGTTYDRTLSDSPWDAYMTQQETTYAIQTVRRLFPRAVPRYLDFACGTGRMTGTIAPLSAEAFGVDVSPTMLQSAREKHPGVSFIQTDVTRNEVDLGPFNLVTSFRFFGNAEQSLRAAVLKALNAMMVDGGYLLVNNHRNPLALANVLAAATGETQTMDLTHSKFRRLLEASGFRIVSSRPVGFFLYRSRLMSAVDRDAPRTAALERRFRSALLVPFSPDALILAQKVRHIEPGGGFAPL